MADLNVSEYPGPLGIHDTAQIAKNIEGKLLDQIINGLTVGSDTAETVTASSNPHDVVFTGTESEVSDYYEAKEWSDGLPIVAPTIERVERFLEFTDRKPDEVVAVLQSANLQATPWNIAVNGVMAGCRPEHMPLLIAAVEALGEERCNLNNIGSSSSLVPFVLINGPIVAELGIQSGAQLVSRPPNPPIGRAIGLIVRNIAGYRPGSTYMGTFGYPQAFALAEHAEGSPWEPFHVEHGFALDESTVTVGITSNWGSSPAPYDRPEKDGASTTLEMLSREIVKKTRIFMFPGRGPDADTAMLTVLLSPSLAQSLAAAGYSKQDVKKYLHENTRMTLREFEWLCRYMSISGARPQEKVAEGVYPKEFAGAPDDIIQVLSGPEILHIIVCGDPNRNRLMVMEGGHTTPTTKAIVLPKKWAELRGK
ncbi:MAG: hypothetical protein Q8M53_01225 [Burkholderiales bacterium]|nr:hypothetical protein [Burkholderiales bacterium]